MSARIIWDHEIKSIIDAADILFSGEGDPRGAYQEIVVVLNDIKMRIAVE